jgi:hypothetical protein
VALIVRLQLSIMRVLIEHLVEFIVTFYKDDPTKDDKPLLLSTSGIDVLFSRLPSQTAIAKHGSLEEKWVCFVDLADADAFEHAIVCCNEVISYERSLLPGDCARTKKFFGRRL